jgi:sulfatase modifying factor 1
MVSFAGGRTRIGSDDGEPIERPTFVADVAPFLLDVHPVTVAEFRRFVDTTGYETQSERFGSSAVFDVKTGTWSLVDGASWRRPLGPSAPIAADDHPVTQVSWNDARAYCRWTGKRLPTEVEWEHAARGGRSDGPRYAWGDALVVDGHYMANTWQGEFPHRNTAADGFVYTAPVGRFGKTASGLTDMGGNVWQWCDDWFRPYAERGTPFTAGADSAKVLRGGSFLCDPKVCHGFRVSARGHSTPETGLAHVGFRCARDAAGPRDAGAGAASSRHGPGAE